MLRLVQIAFILFLSIELCAQSYTNLRYKNISEISDTIVLDTLSIIPNSLKVLDKDNNVIDISYYRVDCPKALLFPSLKLKNECSTLNVKYRVFPIYLNKEYFNKDQKKLLSPDSLLGTERPKYLFNKPQENPFGDNIVTSGSISRGLSFGNNQDVVVNSGLNLQINGILSEGIQIEGAISDKTTPLQPLGNTQKLEEFDRLYLRAYSTKFDVQAGDIEIRSKGSRLLRYNRNVQGLEFSANNYLFTNDDSVLIDASAAVAKGKFARKSFIGVEGNQGPYRLTGAEGEVFIIIIAGSERVYIDGKLMTRGESNQYSIDYNTAEVIFTPRMPITSNSRINIEFEYTERSYARFIVASEVEQRFKKINIHIAAFSENDSKNQPFDQDLSHDQISLLQQIGDKIDQATIAQVDSIEFNVDKILYEKRDTAVNGSIYKIYKHSVNPLTSHFQLNFSYVGEGKGNYLAEYGKSNGSVFKWVAPVNGKQLGNYEPVKVISTPKRKQMASLSVERDFANNGIVKSEFAVSRNDLNTFSSIDKENDLGAAVRLEFERDLFRKDSIHYSWIKANAMYSSTNFSYIDRYRNVEFERDWNITSVTTGGDEKEGTLGFGYFAPKTKVTGSIQGLALGDNFSGLRNSINASNKTKLIKNDLEISNLLTKDSLSSTRFNRVHLKTEYSKIRFTTKINLEGEDNIHTESSSKRILPASYRWYQVNFYIGNPDSIVNSIGASYQIRKDWKTPDSLLKSYSFSQDFSLKGKVGSKQSNRLNFYAGYRLFNPIDTSLMKSAKKENTLLTRIDYSFALAKGFVSSNLGYEIGSGLEPKYQFYYIEVPAGQGVFTWNDYNGNGIKELEEFEIASFKDEAKYIRINLSSNQYISISTNIVSIQCDLRPDLIVKDTSLIGIFASKLSNQFSFSSRQKNDYDDMLASINPFGFDVYDSNIVGVSQNFRNSLAFNRYSRIMGVEWITSSLINKQILANGYEVANQKSNQLIGRVGISSYLSLRGNYTIEIKEQKSENFQFRNYSIKRLRPTLKLRYSSSFGFTLETGYEYEYANNLLGDEVNRKHSVLLDLNYSIRGKAWLNLATSLSAIEYQGVLGTPVEYELLKGFKPGKNSTWELNWRRKISNYFEMDFGYSGRYISTGRVIHTGSMQIRAVF